MKLGTITGTGVPWPLLGCQAEQVSSRLHKPSQIGQSHSKIWRCLANYLQAQIGVHYVKLFLIRAKHLFRLDITHNYLFYLVPQLSCSLVHRAWFRIPLQIWHNMMNVGCPVVTCNKINTDPSHRGERGGRVELGERSGNMFRVVKYL